ncbi:MAG: serine hydrolase [Clostridia bacterium]|nr:serine hydrolase [Clostridia bacterium]MCI9086050.1 serine hydrolase [Clostridia bacterium]
MSEFEKIQPSEAGVPHTAISRFFDELETLPFDIHSVIMIRGRKIFVERYYAPYERDTLHRMYSVTKSLVGLAILCLADEGKIDLDTSITSYFPEYPTEYKDIRDTTIRNMLMMRTAHKKTTYKADLSSDWVKSFFTAEPTQIPGTVFSYDTSSSHTLGALVEKITGMELLDYLRTKFLDKIGFSKSAYCLKDPFGVSIGGSGLMATPLDVAKVARFVMNKGMENGEQLINSELVTLAVSNLSPTNAHCKYTDEQQGYGMQFWRTRNNGFMLYGLGGQMAICLPDKDLIFVVTADAVEYKDGTQIIRDVFWNEIYNSIDKI